MNKQTVVAHTRLNISTYNLLGQISKATHLNRSSLQRAAITQWLQNAPQDLPPELKIAITHELIKQQIETIKQLRWVYYAAEDAKLKIKFIDKMEKHAFSKHVRRLLKQFERQIVAQQKQLDQWIKAYQASMRSDGSNVQVYTGTREGE
jgi:hypothetical protein